MLYKQLLIAVVLAATVQSARVQFYTTRSCSGGASEDYQNVPCNSCVDPPLGERITKSMQDDVSDMFCRLVRCTDNRHRKLAMERSQRGTHLRIDVKLFVAYARTCQNKCTPASQVGQGYGPACEIAGHTAIRSIYVAC